MHLEEVTMRDEVIRQERAIGCARGGVLEMVFGSATLAGGRCDERSGELHLGVGATQGQRALDEWVAVYLRAE